MSLVSDIRAFNPCNEQEERDRLIMLHYLDTHPDALSRQNETAHFTASAWILNREHSKILMIYHNIYNSWSWTGGHADEDSDLAGVAVREAREETGIKQIKVLGDGIFSLEILTVDGHEKRGGYVPSHLHLNVTYLLEADETDELSVKHDENSGVCWFTPEEAAAVSSEPWMRDRIYRKLNMKMNDYRNRGDVLCSQ